MRPRRLAIAAALLVLLSARAARADEEAPKPEALHFLVPFHVTTEGGAELDLSPGMYVPDPLWNRLDLEMRRLQEAETRLAAENTSLRASASEGPGWGTVVLVGVALAAGIAGGAYAF